jgi:large repetitive protein
MNILLRIAMAGMLACGMLFAAPAPTNTSLAVTISGSAATMSTLGETVTLTATVTLQSNSSAVTSGSVTFFSGTDPIGAGLLNGSGQATFKTSLLPSGVNSLTAFYIGVSGTYASSKTATPLKLTVTSNAQIGFSSPNSVKAGPYPFNVAAGDFNGDGVPDLAIADFDDKIRVFTGDGSGGFTEVTGSPFTSGGLTYAVVVGDFNGDGLTDIAAVTYAGTTTITVLLNTGTGTFTVSNVTAVSDDPDAIAVGDFNGDGIADLAFANSEGSTVAVLLGNGSGGFTAAPKSPFSVGFQSSAIVVADFNGDGNADIATADGGTGTISILLGDGTGNFKAATGSPIMVNAGPESPYTLAVADLNGDGFPDLVAGNPLQQTVSVYLNTAATPGQFTQASGSPYNLGQQISQVIVGDFNGDGKLDIASLNGSEFGIISVLFGDGSGNFGSQQDYPISLPEELIAAFATADFNGDGVSDIVTADSQSNNTFSILLGISSATTTTLMSSPNPSTYGQSVLLTATVSPLATAGDTVTFLADNVSLGPAPISVSFGVASANLSTSALTGGTHALTAIYNGGSMYAASSTPTPIQQVVNPAPSATTLTTAPNPSTAGQGVLLNATVTTGATGTVSFYNNAALLATRPLSGNTAAYTVSNLPAGTSSNSITGVYNGDTNYLSSTSNAINQVVMNTTVTSLSLSAGTNPSTIGQSLTIKATVTPSSATGTITFFDGATQLNVANLSSGAASYTTSALTAGAHSLTAVYSGDTGDAGSTSTALTQNVKATTTTTLTAAPNPSVSGQGVLLTATVTAGATGTVSFYDNVSTLISTQPLSGGTPNAATYTVSNLPAVPSPNSITAIYNGDSNNATSTSNAVTQTVQNGTVTSLSLSAGANPSTAGQSLTFKATVTPSAAAGTITFFDGVTQIGQGTLSGGTASLTTSALTAGAHSLTAVYGGDANDGGSTSTALSQNVKAVTTTTLTAAPNPSVSGQGVLLTATVTAGATGTVSFYDNVSTLISTQPLSGGTPNTATYTVSNLAAAPSPNSITAIYSGDSNNATSTSSAVNQVVQNITVTSLSLSAGTNPSASGLSLTFKAAVTPSAATGTITFFDGATQLGVMNLSGGTASYTTSALAAGVHSLKVVYSGDTNDATSTSTILTQTVTGSSTTTLTAAPNPSVSGQGVLLTATVTTGATGTVSFYDNVSTLIFTQPLNGGNPNTAAYTVSNLPVAPSPNSITAVYSGDSNFSTSTSSAVNQIVMNTTVTSLILSSGTNPSTVGQALTFEASVTPSSATGKMTFFDGATQLGKVTLSGGAASYPTSALSGGAHLLTAVYGGDTDDATSTSAPLTQNIDTSTVTTVTAPAAPVFGNVVTLQASVSPRPASAPFGTVTFYDGATVLGTAALPASGSASFTTPMLSQGKREIRARYDGSGAFLPSLSAEAAPQVVVGSNPQGGFKPEVTYPVSPATIPGAVGTVEGDFNGDGHWDLAVITSGAGSPGVEILLGNGDGTFQPPVFYATVSASGTATAIAAGDFNGDGAQDLAVVTSSSIQVLLNNGNGTFGGAIASSPGALSSLDSIAVADFNGDGFPDVIVGGSGSAATVVGNGDGTFQTAAPVAATLSGQVYVVTADFNNDGIADFAVADYAGDLDIFLGSGGGAFAAPAVHSETGNLLSMAAGDINGDGNPDIVLGTTGNNLIVLPGNSAGVLGSPASPSLTAGDAVAALAAIGDFNGDGILDVAVADNQNGGVYVFPSKGDGTFLAPLSYPTPAGKANAIMTGNFAADGLGDIVITDGQEAGVLLGSTKLQLNCGSTAAPVVINTPYSLSCSGSGGAVPYTYSISTGSLPPGSPAFSLNTSTGAITGTPNTLGGSTFTVQVDDSSAPPQLLVSSSLTINVVAPLTPTTTTLSLSAGTNPSTSGQSLTFQATVSPNTATGSVTFFDGVTQLGSGTLSAGIATLTTSALGVGLHSIGATYNGDTNDATSIATTLSQTVNQPAAPPPSGPFIPPASPPTISTTTLPAGQVGKNYSTTLAATGGSGNYSWSSGTLPQGLVISATGTISGTPTAAFNGPITVTVTDVSSSLFASAMLTLTISAPLMISGNGSLGDVAVGAPVVASYTISGGVAPYRVSLTGAPGLGVDSNGNVRGTATQAGSFTPMLMVTDSANSTASLTLSLAVLGVSASLPPGTTSSSYNGSVSGVGGVPPYSYAISGVPPGLSASGGTLAGQAMIEGNYTIGALVTDSNGVGVLRDFSFTITGSGPAGLTIVTTSLPDGIVGQPYSQALEAVGGAPGYTWSKSGGQIPAGLSLSGSGMVSGMPSAPGAYVIGVEASDTSSAEVVGTVTINIQPAPLMITNGAIFPNGFLGVDYPAQILGATGGTPPYSFSVQGSQPGARRAVSAGDLGIAGLALANGQIGGTPGAMGTFGFTLVVTDSSAVPATANLDANLTITANTPDLILSSASASFSVAPGASAPPLPNAITVASSAVSQILTFTTSSSAAWLTVSGSSSTPGSIEVGPNSAALGLNAAGSPYSGTIRVSCTSPACAGKSHTIAVSLIVAAPPAQLSLGSPLLSFTALASNPQPMPEALSIVNAGGGSLAIQAVTASANWISVGTFSTDVAPGPGESVAISVNPAGLSAGYYLGAVIVNSSAGSATIPVTFLLATSGVMTLAPGGTEFSVPQGGALAHTGGSYLVGVSSGSANFNAAVLPGASWLSGGGTGIASPTSPATVSFSINQSAVAALSAGFYYGTIRVSSSGVVDSPQDFQVVLNVGAAGSEVLPDPEAAGLVFIGSNTTPPAQTIQLFGSSANSIGFQTSPTVIDGSGWLTVTPQTGSVSASSPTQISVTANPAGLSAGVYQGGVSFAYASSVSTVNVTLIVPPGASCTGTQLVATQTALVSNFSVSAALPVPLAVQLRDTCGNAIGNAQVVAAFSNGDAPLILSAVDTVNGIYAGSWTPRNTSSQVTILTTAFAPGYTTATTQTPGQVAPDAAPALAPNGTLDVFNPQIGAGLAPGNIVQIYGSGLAGPATASTVLPLPTAVNGTGVTIGGLNAPLYYVSPGQINAQVPFELAAGGQYQVVVNANGALTTPQTIQLTQADPAILQFNSGAVVAQHHDGTLVQDSSPAAPGEFITIYLSGMGATNGPVASGAASPGNPLANVADTATLTLNGAQLPVLFEGLTPTLVGLYQIDFQVPQTLANGNYTLSIAQSGTASNNTVLPVKN